MKSLLEQIQRTLTGKKCAGDCDCLSTWMIEIDTKQIHLCQYHASQAINILQASGISVAATKAGFVTIEGKPVFIGGPSQGAGGTSGGGGGGGSSASASLEERAAANRLGLAPNEVGFASVAPEQFVDSRTDNLPVEFEPFVTPYTPKEYVEMDAKCFLSESGKTGFVLKPDGDIISVFSNPDVREGKWAIASAIANGGSKLDCFSGFLSDKFYPSFGFNEYDRWTWDDQYSPPNWNYGKYNRPDVVLMNLGE